MECDFSGMALVCLYAREGKELGEGDPYDIGLNYEGSDDMRRKIVKRYVNALINDTHGRFRIDSDSLQTLGLTSRELRRRVCKRHAEVQHMFRTGVGLELQCMDSIIAERVMLRFIECDEVCLPVHDSFIVRRGLQKRLLQVMQEEFEGVTGARIDIKASMTDDVGGLFVPSDSDTASPVGHGIAALVEILARNLGRHSICTGYLQSWREQRMTPFERDCEDAYINQSLAEARDGRCRSR